MVVYYRIKVLDFEIRMKHISQEMQQAKNKIIFHVHNEVLCIKNADISKQRVRQFYLDLLPVGTNLVNEFMAVTAYKVHNTGTLIMLGTTCVDITTYVNNAIEKDDVLTTIPGSFHLRNAAGKFVAKLECDIQLMIKTDRFSPDYNDPNLQQCDVMDIEEGLEFPNPFDVSDAAYDAADSAAEKINKEDTIKKD